MQDWQREIHRQADLSSRAEGLTAPRAQAILDARALYPDSTLAQLYDPLLMPAELVQAHQRLDRAVERCYRPEPFASDRERVEFLFRLYEQLTAPLLPAPTRRRRRSAS